MDGSTKSEGSPDAEKSASVSLRSEEQSENRTDHLNYWHRHQKWRHWVGAGHETSALDISPQKWAGVGGVESSWGIRNLLVRVAGKRPPRGSRKQSIRLAGQRLPRSLESGASQVEGAIRQGLGSRKPHQREPGRRAGSAGETRFQCWGG